MVVEKLAPDCAEDLVTESEDLCKRLGQEPTSEVSRLSFFLSPDRSDPAIALGDARFLGYAIIRTDRFKGGHTITRVHESVIQSSRIENNFVHGAPEWKCRVGGEIFSIVGYLYAQQNGYTNVCAHVALRTMISAYHPEGDMTYREMNQLLGIDHGPNWVGVDLRNPEEGRGLSLQQMMHLLGQQGARCIQADYSGQSAPPTPYQRYLYGSIESGFPAAIIFDTKDPGSQHVIPVFGHTFNRDLWVSNAEQSYFKIGEDTRFLPSDSWLSTFVMHDDNWGSNFCCPKHFLRSVPSTVSTAKPNADRADSAEWLAHVIATLPKEIKMNPLHAEAIGLDFLSTLLPSLPGIDNIWSSRLDAYFKAGLVVYRTVSVSGGDYADHLQRLRGWAQRSKVEPKLMAGVRSLLGEKRYWMVEISVPELFSANLRKIGEVLLDTERTPMSKRDFDTFTLARIPGYFAVIGNADPAKPKFEFIPTCINSHVALYGCEDV